MSYENTLNNGETKADMIIIDVQKPMSSRKVAIDVYNAFVKNKTIQEIWLFKGSRRIVVKGNGHYQRISWKTCKKSGH